MSVRQRLPAEIRPVLENGIPAVMVTCSADGIPNVTVISQVYYVDETHAALSFQFFSKTIRNVRENPRAYVCVSDIVGQAQWVLQLEFQRSETEGPIFDAMDMQIEAIASATGMSGIFKLRAADIYRRLFGGDEFPYSDEAGLPEPMAELPLASTTESSRADRRARPQGGRVPGPPARLLRHQLDTRPRGDLRHRPPDDGRAVRVPSREHPAARAWRRDADGRGEPRLRKPGGRRTRADRHGRDRRRRAEAQDAARQQPGTAACLRGGAAAADDEVGPRRRSSATPFPSPACRTPRARSRSRCSSATS